MSTKLTACVVGCGNGGKLSMKALAASDQFALVAVADVNPAACAKVAELYPGLRTFTSHQEMFRTCPCDVVCVSTWAPSHRDVTLAALELPLRGILVEKPLGDTAAAGRDILAAIKKRHLPLAVPHGMLVSEHIRQILQHVHGGAIGQLKLVEIQCAKWDIINAGIHWLNFVVALLQGEPIAHVLAACDTTTRTYRDGMQVETLSVASIQTVSGVRIIMHSGDDTQVNYPQKSTFFRLLGTAGVLEFVGWESSYRLVNAQHPAGLDVQATPDARSRHQIHLENMAAQIAAGAPDYRVADSSLLALELCEAAYVSHRHRCVVTFPFANFVPPAPNDWDPGVPYRGQGGGRDGRKLP